MNTNEFIHLHLHSQYSLLDGAIRIDELLPRVKEQNMEAVAVTDHGNMFGAVHFYNAAKKHGVKPIIGCEAYITSKSRFDRSARDSAHLILLAADNTGYRNLSYLISMGFLEGFYYNPRIDKELLKKHSAGLYGLSACLGGVINKSLFHEGLDSAIKTAKEFKEIFMPEHFFIELQDNGLPEQYQANESLLEIAKAARLPLVATADAHYLKPEDAKAHEILMCIGQSRSLKEFREKHQHSSELYVKDTNAIAKYFNSFCPEALENTHRIAKACNVELNFSQIYMPNYTVPSDSPSQEDYLTKIAHAGLKTRLQESLYKVDEKVYRERLDYELQTIISMGFAGYFLIVWDFIKYAKEHQIPVGPGRGSGAGSLVAWSLRITDLDPLPHGLIFERFLNPERVSLPDFDIDFCQNKRGEVIEYVAKKYGAQNVGQIITYSQLSAKSVIKDVGRVMELPFAEVNELTKLIPGLLDGKKVSLAQALELEPRLTEIQKEKPIYKEVMAIAQRLEGLNRQTGIHAAGIVIGDKPLFEYIPVCAGKDKEIVTQFAKDEVEAMGLIKFDFLGLKTLTVIAKTVEHIRKRPDTGPIGENANFTLERIPFNDKKVYKLISNADTDGVFQLESSGFKEFLKKLKPDCFEDIIAGGALYRPGPLDAGMVDDYIARKHGKKKISYPHPVCASILKSTYGLLVYQEQVMHLAVTLAGFSIGEADLLRKAMGKKKADVMAKLREQFVTGAEKNNGMPPKDADELFSLMEKFAGYAFNKSHSACYAVISYQTAYLKTHYPTEFFAALLSTEMQDQDNIVKYIQNIKSSGITILPPNVKISERDFSVSKDKHKKYSILFGLGAIKGIGDAAIEAIIEARKDHDFQSFFDFCEHTEKMNKRIIEALIKSGAFDVFGEARSAMYQQIDKALAIGQAASKDRAFGQTSIFSFLDKESQKPAPAKDPSDSHTPLSQTEEWSPKELLAFEKEALGFYITGHPLDAYALDLQRLCNAHTLNLSQFVGKNDPIFIGGVVSHLKERPLKSGGGRMAFVTLEDLYGNTEVIVFSKLFAKCEKLLKNDEPLIIQGQVIIEGQDRALDNPEEEEKGQLKLRAQDVFLLTDFRLAKAKNLNLSINTKNLPEEKLRKFQSLLLQHKGPVKTTLHLIKHHLAGSNLPKKMVTIIRLPENLEVLPTTEFLTATEELFGKKHLRMWFE